MPTLLCLRCGDVGHRPREEEWDEAGDGCCNSCVASRCHNSYVNLRLVLGTDCIHGGYLSTFDCCAVAFRWFKRFHSRPRGTLQQQKGETDVKPPAAKKAKTTFSFQDAD